MHLAVVVQKAVTLASVLGLNLENMSVKHRLFREGNQWESGGQNERVMGGDYD
jgi:hypothetical protein